MNTFRERIAIGEHMDPKQLEAEVRGLVMDTRFTAVLGLIKQQREAFVSGGTGQAMAPHHGSMAHCSGSVYALDTLLQTLGQFVATPKRRGEKAPPAEAG